MEPSIQELLTRLDRLSGPFHELRDGVRKAVRLADEDPEMALTRTRKVLEQVVREAYERRCKEPPGTRPLENLIQRLVRDGHLPGRLEAYAHAVRLLGNVGTHRFGEAVVAADVWRSLSQLTPILDWYIQEERPNALTDGPAEPPPAPAASTPTAPPRRMRRFPLAGALLVGGGLLVLLVLLAPRLNAWLSPPPDRGAAPPPPAGWKGFIDVVIYDPDDPRRQNVRLNDPDVLPLKPGDLIAVEAQLDRPGYCYILWIDADGSIDPVYPWRPGHWEERPAEERPVQHLRRPEASDRFVPIKPSAAGMETLALLVRDTPLPRDVDLRAELGPVPPQALQSLRSTAWFEDGVVVRGEPGRSAAEWDEQRVGDPVRETQEQIRSRLGGLFPYTRAVSFADRGK